MYKNVQKKHDVLKGCSYLLNYLPISNVSGFSDIHESV